MYVRDAFPSAADRGGGRMTGSTTPATGDFPVRYLNRHALVELPEEVSHGNAEPVRERLLDILDRDIRVLLVDMTWTASCDHTCGDALAWVYQRAVASGTELRLISDGASVRRMLTMSGLDQVAPVYRSVGAALAATAPASELPPGPGPGPAGPAPAGARPTEAPGGAGTEIALLDTDGVITWVNDGWQAFAAANGADPARTGP